MVLLMSQVRSRGGEMKKEVEAIAPTSPIGSIILLEIPLQQALSSSQASYPSLPDKARKLTHSTARPLRIKPAYAGL